MKNILKYLCIVSLLSSFCTSCGNTAPVSTGENTDDTANTAAASTETTEAKYEFPKLDYNEKTFTFAELKGIVADSAAYLYNEIYSEGENGDIVNDSVFKRNCLVEELYNIKIDTFEIGDSNKRGTKPDRVINSILAGSDDFDVIILPTRAVNTLVSGSSIYVTPLNDVDTLNLENPWWNQECIDAYTINKNLYFATGDMCYMEKMSPMLFFFNKQLVENQKLESPYKMVENGTWTTDNMIAMTKQSSSDIDGDTKMDPDNDQYGFMGQRDCLWYWVIGSGISAVGKDNDDNPQIVLDTEKCATLTKKIMGLFTDSDSSLIASYIKPKNYPDSHNMFRSMVTSGRGLFYYNTLCAVSDLRKLEGDFGILPVPKYDENQSKYYTLSSTWYGTNVLIPKTNSDLDMTGYVLDAMGYYSQMYITPAVIDTSITVKGLRDEESGKMLEYVFDGLRYDLENVYTFGIADVFNKLVDGKVDTFASIYDSSKSAITEKFDKIIEAIIAE